MTISPIQRDQILKVVSGLFNAVPGGEILNELSGIVESGTSVRDLASTLTQTTQFKNEIIKGKVTVPDQVKLLLNNFGLESGAATGTPDAIAEAHFTARIEQGWNLGHMVFEAVEFLSQSNLEPAFVNTANLLNNKAEAAGLHALHLNITSVENGANVLAGVTSDADFDATTYLEDREDLGGTPVDPGIEGNPGQTFTLTNGVDNLVGTDANDTFIAALTDDSRTTTLTAGDNIDGGAGTDTLRIISTNDDYDSQGAITLNNVERVEVQAFNGDIELNATNWNGVETIALVNGDHDVDVDNLNAIVDAEMRDTNGSLDLSYRANAVTGANDVQNVAIDGVSGEFYAFGIETINASVTGAFEDDETNTVNFSSDTMLKTLNISGDGNLITSVQDSVTTLDASSATGNITATINGALDVTATGGSGDDTFIFGGNLTAADVVVGGEGFDTVAVTAGNLVALPMSAADAKTLAGLKAMTSIEQVEFGGGGSVQFNHSTLINADLTHVLFNTSGNAVADIDTVGNAKSSFTYGFGEGNDGDATFDMSGGNTTLNLEMTGTEGKTAVSEDGINAYVGTLEVKLASVDAAATATINITSLGDFKPVDWSVQTTFNEIDDIVVGGGSIINITGNAALEIDHLENNATVDASALTGDFKIEGSEFDATGAVLVSGADTITLGSGSSTIYFDDGLDSGVGADSAGNSYGGDNLLMDEIINFTAGADGDVLQFGTTGKGYTAISAVLQSQIDLLSGGAATLRAAADIADSVVDDAVAQSGWTAFSFQGNTYALYDADEVGVNFQDADDVIIQLTGVTVADLTADNFA